MPQSPRTRSGYRTYAGDTLRRLAFIQAAQAIGLTVAEIREVIAIRDGGNPPCAHVLDLIKRHRAEVRARIRQLLQLEQTWLWLPSKARMSIPPTAIRHAFAQLSRSTRPRSTRRLGLAVAARRSRQAQPWVDGGGAWPGPVRMCCSTALTSARAQGLRPRVQKDV